MLLKEPFYLSDCDPASLLPVKRLEDLLLHLTRDLGHVERPDGMLELVECKAILLRKHAHTILEPLVSSSVPSLKLLLKRAELHVELQQDRVILALLSHD